jgi:hypothetical protein
MSDNSKRIKQLLRLLLTTALLAPVTALAQAPPAVSRTSYRSATASNSGLPDLGLDRLAMFGRRWRSQPAASMPVYVPDQEAVVIDDEMAPACEMPAYGEVYDYGQCCYPPPPWAHRCNVYFDYLYLRARNAELVYATPVDGPVTPPGNPANPGNQVAQLAMLDPEFQSAFRLGFWWARDDSTSWGLSYTRFESHVNSSIDVQPGIFIQSLVTHPGVQNAEDNWQRASARLDTDYELLDADARWLLAGGDNFGLNLISGLRLGRLQQDFDSTFEINGWRSLDTGAHFDGGGLRLGLDGARYVTNGGLMVYGHGIVSLLAGRISASYTQTSAFSGTEVNTYWKAGRIVPTVDLEAGIGWRSRCDRLRLSLGYTYTTWFNTLAMDEWIDAVNANSFAGLGGDSITFDGLVAHGEWRF